MFNSEIEETFNQANWAVENQKFEYAQEVIGEGLTKIKQRNKHIKLADSSEGGWETVKQYQSNPLASDSDDEKKLQKAEFRAAQKKRRQEPKSFGKKKFKHGYSDSCNPMQSNVVFPSWSQGATGSVQWVNLYREHRTSPFVNSRDTQDQRGVVSLVGASCTGEKSAPLSEPSRQPAAQLSSEGIIHEQDQDSFKDEYFLTNNFL